MISISGFIFLNDFDLGRKYGTKINHSIVEIDKVNGTYSVLIKLFRNQVEVSYLLEDLQSLNSHEKKVVFRFTQPKHEVVVLSDDIDKVDNFLKNLRSLIKHLNLTIIESSLFDSLRPFSNLSHYNFQNLNLSTLRIITLENCYLPSMPEDIGNLTISSLSLTGSKLDTSKYGQDYFWDWMTKDKISKSLNVLEMNSIGLRKLPFEIIHLKRLQGLSVANNKLTHIPHFVGELPQLKTLIVNGNTLWYFPDSLLSKVFHSINIMNNRFIQFNEIVKNIESIKYSGLYNVPKLTEITIVSLINNRVKFKRQKCPRPLWNCFDFLCRCRLCKKLFIFDETYQHYILNIPPQTEQFMEIDSICWQYFECRPSCAQ